MDSTWAAESRWLWENRNLATAFSLTGSPEREWKTRRRAQEKFVDSLSQVGTDRSLLVDAGGQKYRYSSRDGLEFVKEIKT